MTIMRTENVQWNCVYERDCLVCVCRLCWLHKAVLNGLANGLYEYDIVVERASCDCTGFIFNVFMLVGGSCSTCTYFWILSTRSQTTEILNGIWMGLVCLLWPVIIWLDPDVTHFICRNWVTAQLYKRPIVCAVHYAMMYYINVEEIGVDVNQPAYEGLRFFFVSTNCFKIEI